MLWLKKTKVKIPTIKFGERGYFVERCGEINYWDSGSFGNYFRIIEDCSYFGNYYRRIEDCSLKDLKKLLSIDVTIPPQDVRRIIRSWRDKTKEKHNLEQQKKEEETNRRKLIEKIFKEEFKK